MVRAGAFSSAVQPRRLWRDLWRIVEPAGGLLDVRAVEPVVRVARPLREAVELSGRERRDLVVHVESCTGDGRSSEPESHGPRKCALEVAIRTGGGTEPECPRQLGRGDLCRHVRDPQRRKPAEQRRRAWSDRRGPALLGVLVGQVVSESAQTRMGVLNRAEGQHAIGFHAHVGPPQLRMRAVNSPAQTIGTATGISNGTSTIRSKARKLVGSVKGKRGGRQLGMWFAHNPMS